MITKNTHTSNDDEILDEEISSLQIPPVEGRLVYECMDSVEDIKIYMNQKRMNTEKRLAYWIKIWDEWQSQGISVIDVEHEITLCQQSLDYRLMLKKWRVRYDKENLACDYALKETKSQEYNLHTIDYNHKSQRKPINTMKNCFYLKIGNVENKLLGTLLDDMEKNLIIGGYIFPQEGVTLKMVMGYRQSTDECKPVKWQGTLAELHEWVRYMIDDLHVMDCPSGYNIRWQITVNCFVDRNGNAIKLQSLSRSTSINQDDIERLHKCIPRFVIER